MEIFSENREGRINFEESILKKRDSRNRLTHLLIFSKVVKTVEKECSFQQVILELLEIGNPSN